MLTIYIAQIDSIWTPSRLHDELSLLPPLLSAKIAKYKNPKDQQTRILAKLMLQQLLIHLQLPLTLLDLLYTQSHKPYFNHHGFDFSTAHSGDIVLCGGLLDTKNTILDSPTTGNRQQATLSLGIDLEFLDTIDLNLYQDYLTRPEWLFIHQCEHPQQVFYSIWTRKEALAKATGAGADMVFRQVEILDDTIDYHGNTYYVENINIDADYMGAVVSNKKLEINILDFVKPPHF